MQRYWNSVDNQGMVLWPYLLQGSLQLGKHTMPHAAVWGVLHGVNAKLGMNGRKGRCVGGEGMAQC